MLSDQGVRTLSSHTKVAAENLVCVKPERKKCDAPTWTLHPRVTRDTQGDQRRWQSEQFPSRTGELEHGSFRPSGDVRSYDECARSPFRVVDVHDPHDPLDDVFRPWSDGLEQR